MKREMIFLNLVLLVGALWLGYGVRRKWVNYKATHQIALLKPSVEAGMVTSSTEGLSSTALNYGPISENFLFSPDRSSVVPRDPEAAQKVAGPKPVLMGIMAYLDDPVALMVSSDPKAAKDYKRLKKGESIDGYTLVKFQEQIVVMTVDGKEVEVRLNEPAKIVPREVAVQDLPSSRSERMTTIGAPPTGATSETGAASPVAPRAEAVPAGTVINGRVKKMVPSPFGPMEAWVDVKQQ